MLTLNEALTYKHPAVVRRYQKDHPEKAQKAEQLFDDLMRFFWISKKHQIEQQKSPNDERLKFVMIMDEEMRDIDQIWHIFLLYTKDYMEFCYKNYGEYLHHLPDIVPTFQAGSFDYQENLKKFLEYTYDHLGEDVIARWFEGSLQ